MVPRLVFNLHIATNQNTIILPNDKTQLAGDGYAEFLFDISSPLPQSLFALAKERRFSPEPGARCFGYNADEPMMIQLLQFGSIGVTRVKALPPPTD